MNAHVIGGGIAGLSAGLALAKSNYNVIIWEKEKVLCPFASSRNAAIFRTYEADPVVSLFVKKSFIHILELEKVGYNFLNKIGLILNPYEIDYYEKPFIHKYPEMDELISRDESLLLPNRQLINGIFIPGNGILDIHLMQDYFLKALLGLGGTIQYNKKICIEKVTSKRVAKIRVDDSKEVITLGSSDIVVNAAGSWAKEIFQHCLDKIPPLIPHKRHLYHIKSNLDVSHLPVVWDEKKDIYFRPEVPGLIATHCDQRPTNASDFHIDDLETHKFLESVTTAYPFLKDFHISKSWACLRTFPLDNLPVVGFDETVENLLWFTGLGGRGMSMAFSLSEFLYEGIEKKTLDDDVHNPISPKRFW